MAERLTALAELVRERPVLASLLCAGTATAALLGYRVWQVTSATSRKPWDSWTPRTPTVPDPESGISVEFWEENGVKLEVWKKGATQDTGKQLPPIVFVHGGFHTAACYENYIEYFAEKGLDCFALSLRSHGASTRVPGSELFHTLSENAWDVGVVVGRLLREGRKPPIIFGHSKGSIVTKKFLTYPPSNVAEFAKPCSLYVHFNGFPPPPNEFAPFINWAKIDFLHLVMGVWTMNPFWSLGTPKIAARVFYSPAMPEADAIREWSKLERIEAGPDAESLFGKPYCVPETLLTNCSGKLLVVGATSDVLMPPATVDKTFGTFNGAAVKINETASSQGKAVVERVTVPGGHCHFVEPTWKEGAEIVSDALVRML